MKKLFKKIIVSVLSFVFLITACTFLTACGEDRSTILKLYVPGEYITNEVLSGFETWYKEQTGKNITVKKTEFDTNETMYTMVATKKVDYDVICPSDYMLERMKKEGLLLKVDSTKQELVQERVLGENNENQNLVNIVKMFDQNFEYAVPYMWGTMGIMYYYDDGNLNNKTAVDNADLAKSSWNALFDCPEQSVYMKDSYRDTYTIALIQANRQLLENTSSNFTDYEDEDYQTLLESFFVKGTDSEFTAKVNAVKAVLEAQKNANKVYKYEVDDGKQDLILNHKFGMFWSCDAGYIMADYSGEEVEYTEEFRYIVPKEASNVWLDCFCIPKYSKNQSAANLFMEYITQPEVAYACMDYAGCTSAVYQTTEDYYNYLYPEFLADGTYTVSQIEEMTEQQLIDNELVDEDGEYVFDIVFAKCSDAFKSNYLSLMFPHLRIEVGEYVIESPLSRCGVMRDLGSRANDELATMWANIKK